MEIYMDGALLELSQPQPSIRLTYRKRSFLRVEVGARLRQESWGIRNGSFTQEFSESRHLRRKIPDQRLSE
jgi:hypothetical protein